MMVKYSLGLIMQISSKIILVLNLFFITSCGATMKRFDWLASESAPNGFPMKIVTGSFYDSKGGSLYIPNGRIVHHGWGVGVSTHIVGADEKNLPDKFDVLCFSYVENAFYAGSFELPFDKIYKLFNDGYYSPNTGENITFREMIVGVAPGGYVTVWASGIDKQIEVFNGQLSTVDFPWEKFLDNPNITREKYIDLVLNDSLTPQELQRIKDEKTPFGIWKEYSKRYPWKPLITGEKSEDLVDWIHFFNGERNYYSSQHNNSWLNESYPVPRKLNLTWYTSGGRKLEVTLTFTENEILKSFSEMSKQTEKPFVFNIDINKQGNEVRYSTTLVVDDIIIPVNNTQVTYR